MHIYVRMLLNQQGGFVQSRKLSVCRVCTSAMAIVSRSFDSLRIYVGSFTWGPFVKLSRSTVLGLLGRIEIGQLVVKDCDGTGTICGGPGDKDGSPQTELKVLKEAFWVRVMLFADMVGGPNCLQGIRLGAQP